MPKQTIVIYWSRRDFRTTDNKALNEAINYAASNKLVFLPIYILDPNLLKSNVGYPRKKYLSVALAKFSQSFNNFTCFFSDPFLIFTQILTQFNVALFFNQDIEPYSLSRDQKIEELVLANEGKVFSFSDTLLVSKDLKTQTGNIYSVFTPFKNAAIENFLNLKPVQNADLNFVDKLKFNWNDEISKSIINCNQSDIFQKIDSPNIIYLNNGEFSVNIDEIFNRQNIQELAPYFDQTQAINHFRNYLENDILAYKTSRDFLGLSVENKNSTSSMSIALKWGLVSASMLVNMIIEKFGLEMTKNNESLSHYMSELLWREFYKYTLFHFPSVLNLEYQPKYQNSISWVGGQAGLDLFTAWIKGQTGYKVVDAAMAEISLSYKMHNRSRMIVASILTKNLGIDWRWGQEYFRAMLLDLDEAANNGGWQWASSTGSDPKPIRIFNPYLQAQNYDKDSVYTNYWLEKAEKQHGLCSPFSPIIEHDIARQNALIRYKQG